MATACLNNVSAALNTSDAIGILLEHFRSAGKVDKKATAAEYAPEALNRLRELLEVEHGIRIGKLSDSEIASMIEGADTKDDSCITSKEYQNAMETVVKYASLRARRSPRTRFVIGVVCSAASAVAITAATAAVSAGVLAAAAPVGAAVGAVAVGASSLGSTRRDRKRAAKHTPSVPSKSALQLSGAAHAGTIATAVARGMGDPVLHTTPDTATTAEASVAPGAADDIPPAAPSAALMTLISPRSDELVSAVLEVSSAGPTAAAAAKETPFSAVTQSPLSLTITDSSSESAAVPAGASSATFDAGYPAACDDDADFPALPELLLSPSPHPPASEAGAEDSVQDLLTPAVSLDVTRSADLPPLAKKKKPSPSKKLKKSLSKGYKSFKKAMSISSSTDLHAAAAVAHADKDASSPFAAKPPSGFSFRRSFSRDSAKDMSVEGLSVQGSEGSATLKKMKELLRRSFTLSTPRNSLDVSNSGTRARVI